MREEDTDWRRWLLGKPYRPFDPRMYFEFRLYKDFSSGIADQWMSHGIDLVHYFLDDEFPRSVMAQRRRLRLAGRARESGHVPGPARIPEGLPGQLLHQLRQRLRQLHAASWARTRRSSTSAARAARAGSGSRRRARTSRPGREARREVRHAARRRPDPADLDQRRRPVAHDELDRVPAQPASRRTRPCGTGSPTPWPASWPRARIGKAGSSTGTRARSRSSIIRRRPRPRSAQDETAGPATRIRRSVRDGRRQRIRISAGLRAGCGAWSRRWRGW